MSEHGYWVHFAQWTDFRDELQALREEVFVAEQGVPMELERDDSDGDCVHLLARDAEGSSVGTARISAQGKIGRMAVSRPWRGRGVGAAMLCALLHYWRDSGRTEAHLHAQTSAVDFYGRHGFVPHGAVFMDAGIPHRQMTLDLRDGLPSCADRSGPEVGGGRLGVTRNTRHLRLAEQHRLALVDLVAQARHDIRIFSDALDPTVFDHPSTVEALRRFATRRHHASVRIVVRTPGRVPHASPGVLELARHLASTFELRAAAMEHQHLPDELILVDGLGSVHRPAADSYAGVLQYTTGARTIPLLELFTEAWQHATPSAELRRLHL